MNVPSFQINHDALLKGVYISRKDEVGSEIVTTFDIRMKLPNSEPAMETAAIHTLEHLMAVYLRGDEKWSKKVLYIGPMGCRTGMYLLLIGNYEPIEIVPLLTDLFTHIAQYDDPIPGTLPRDCGNNLDHSLPIAKWEANKFLSEVLQNITEQNMIYPE